MLDFHKEAVARAESENAAYRELLSNFVKDENRGAFIRTIQKLNDPDGIKQFDEMVEMASSRFPELLDWDEAESAGKDDAEYALFRRLQRGLVPIPPKHDPDIIDAAFDYQNRFRKEGFSAAFDGDLTKTQFAANRAEWWSICRYHAREHHANQRHNREEKAEIYRREAPE